MALFKIFNNISSKKLDETTNKYQYNALPSTSHTGYCYFDAGTNLFYIDIADSSEDIDINTLSESEQLTYRVPLNAANASYSSVALKDFEGNIFSDTYLASLRIVNTKIIGMRPDGSESSVTLPQMVGSTSTTVGTSGLVPAPPAGSANYFLRGGGTWAPLSGNINGTSYNGIDSITTSCWGDVRIVTIQDASQSNTGMGTSINGSSDFSLLLPATIKATLDGNAATASKWTTACNITIGDKKQPIDGSSDVTYTLSDIGAAASSHTHAIANITNLQTTLNNLQTAIDGKAASSHLHEMADVTGLELALNGKAASSHTHSYAGSNSVGGAATSADKVNQNLIIKLNGGSTEGTNLFTFNGSTTKTIDITAGGIGAAASSHTHNYAGSSSVGGAATSANKLNTNAGSSTKPVYFNNGVPTVVGDTLGVNITGNAVTATKVNHNLQLTVGGTIKGTYNGSDTCLVDINPVDLNISGALKYIGRVQSKPANNITSITLVSGSSVSVATGNVVICVDDGREYVYDDTGTWEDLGAATSFSITAHIHGNIDNSGYLTSSLGVAQSNYLVWSGNDGLITTGPKYFTTSSTNISNSPTGFIESNISGSASKWTTARDLTIGNKTQTIDGSANVTYSLNDIGAAASSHTHNYAGSSSVGGAATSVQGTLTINYGSSTKAFNGKTSQTVDINLTSLGAAASGHNHDATYLKLSGGVMTGGITGKTINAGWINMSHNGAFKMSTAPTNGTAASALTIKTLNGSWGIGSLATSDNLYFVYGTDANYNNGTNTTSNFCITPSGEFSGTVSTAKKLGNLAVGSTSRPVYFNNGVPVQTDATLDVNISGSSQTAYKWAEARTLTLSGDVTGSVSFNGETDFSLSNTIGTGKITTTKIKDANVTRAKMANDALYSPIQLITASTTLAMSHVGKTLTTNGASTNFVFTVSSSSIDNGFEVAILNYLSTSTTVTFNSDENILIYGEDSTLMGKSFTLDKYAMIALKKIADKTWLLTGPAEVV